MTKAHRAPAFASAQNPSLEDQVLDRLVAIHKWGDFRTLFDDQEGAYCEVYLINEDGTSTSIGDHFIWWPKVQMALKATTRTVPFIAGRLICERSEHRLRPLTMDENALVLQGLSTLYG